MGSPRVVSDTTGPPPGDVEEDRTALLRYCCDLTRPTCGWEEFRDLFFLASA